MEHYAANPGEAETALFHAHLTPHRSLGRKGLFVVAGLILIPVTASGVFFLSLGAWPVFGFFGLDLAAIGLAFWLNIRSGRAREEVRLSRSDLSIRKIAPSGKERAFSFNPFWTRFSIRRHSEIGIVSMRVRAKNGSADLGTFLNPADRESFAQAFSSALARARS